MNLSKTPPFTANEQVILVLVIFLSNLQRCRGRRCFRVLPYNKRRGSQNRIGSWTWTERHGFLFIRMVRHKQFLVCALLYSVVVSEPDPLAQTIGHGRLQSYQQVLPKHNHCKSPTLWPPMTPFNPTYCIAIHGLFLPTGHPYTTCSIVRNDKPFLEKFGYSSTPFILRLLAHVLKVKSFRLKRMSPEMPHFRGDSRK